MNKIIVSTLLLVLSSCGVSNSKQADKCECVFKSPDIPTVITAPQDRVEFLSKHYWDNFNFSDTACVKNMEVTEQAFANYINIILNSPVDMAQKSITDMMKRAEVDTASYNTFTSLSEKYLYDPNSPMRNEALYMAVLRQMIASEKVDTLMKMRPIARLNMALKNMVGNKANDFRYTLANAREHRLYDIRTKYTLLFINNPDCEMCKHTCDGIAASALVSKMLADGSLTILAIYTDEDISAWRKNIPNFPATWVNGYDKQLKMRSEELYDLRAIPTLYLMDRNKTVLKKDFVSVEEFEEYFETKN